jgi:hypothetical protein
LPSEAPRDRAGARPTGCHTHPSVRDRRLGRRRAVGRQEVLRNRQTYPEHCSGQPRCISPLAQAAKVSADELRLLVGLVRSVFAAAALDQLVPTSPFQRVTLPCSDHERIVPLAVEQVSALADANATAVPSDGHNVGRTWAANWRAIRAASAGRRFPAPDRAGGTLDPPEDPRAKTAEDTTVSTDLATTGSRAGGPSRAPTGFPADAGWPDIPYVDRAPVLARALRVARGRAG